MTLEHLSLAIRESTSEIRFVYHTDGDRVYLYNPWTRCSSWYPKDYTWIFGEFREPDYKKRGAWLDAIQLWAHFRFVEDFFSEEEEDLTPSDYGDDLPPIPLL